MHSRSNAKKLAASAAVLAAVGAFVSFGVFSSFSSTQSNSSSLTTGTLTLTQQTPTSLITSLTDLIPGDVVTRCVKVTKDNASNIASTVSMVPAVTSSTGADTLANVAKISVESGTGLSTDTGACTGFNSTGFLLGTSDVTSFGGLKTIETLAASTPESYATGDWANGASKMYRVTVSLPTTVGNALQGKTGTFSLTWTATQVAGQTNR